MGNVVAIDAGTTGVRALVVDERARVVDVAYREITQYFPRPGWVEHDPVEIWDAVCGTLAEVGSRLSGAGGTVAAIGITNQRETLVAFDRSDGRPLHRAIVWQDRRTAPACRALADVATIALIQERALREARLRKASMNDSTGPPTSSSGRGATGPSGSRPRRRGSGPRRSPPSSRGGRAPPRSSRSTSPSW